MFSYPLSTLTHTARNPRPHHAVCEIIRAADGVALRTARFKRTPDTPVRGTVCLVQGRGEFIEKYFEVVAELNTRGFAVATFDWRGQGGSERLCANPRKGHVAHIHDYHQDLHAFIKQIVLPDCPPPYYALGHSMGGLVLLLADSLKLLPFQRMVLTAPLIRWGSVYPPQNLSYAVAQLLSGLGLGSLYVPGGDGTFEGSRPFAANPLTSDPERYARTAFCADRMPELTIGAPTLAWVRAVCSGMALLQNRAVQENLLTPCIIVGGSLDTIVDNLAAAQLARHLKNTVYLEIPAARHELLMESDAHRSALWALFDPFIPGEAHSQVRI